MKPKSNTSTAMTSRKMRFSSQGPTAVKNLENALKLFEKLASQYELASFDLTVTVASPRKS